MQIKIRKITEFLGSRWMFGLTLFVFVAETSWLALTSRFPMAFDEGYHFGLIQFFGHRLNPIVTSQPADTYTLGNIVQNSSFLYHYLMSFPYRLIVLFTHNLDTQIVCLRFINIALAVAGLLIMRRLLRLLRLSDALANVIILAFALTPMVTDLSAQISYDNLFIPAVSLCAYETIVFIRHLDKGRFDTKTLLSLLALCLFSSLIKFAFLPVFAAIVILLAWKLIGRRRSGWSNLLAEAKKDFAAINKYARLSLIVVVTAGSLLFARFYVVDIVKYHNPAPQCNQILTIQDCKQYYAWDNNYTAWRYHQTHPSSLHWNFAQYGSYWVIINIVELYGVIMPLRGGVYNSIPYLVFIGIPGTIALICTIANFNKLRKNQDLVTLIAISFVYISVLWARNYHDYLRQGWPAAIDARYLIPVLIFLYVLLASGLRYMLEELGVQVRRVVKVGLAAVIGIAFLYYGGFHQYLHYIDPVYGRIDASNNFTLDYTPPKN